MDISGIYFWQLAGCSGGALVGALMLTGAEGLKKVKAGPERRSGKDSLYIK